MILSKIDLRYAYHQVRIKDEDIYKTTFRNRYRHFELVMLPFGLINAPATFMTLMRGIFHPFLDKFVLNFMNDILIYSNTMEEQKEHLCIVMKNVEGPPNLCEIQEM